MSATNPVFGIDLGTTFSAIAYVDEYGQTRVLMNQENMAVTPSVVYFDSPQNVLVGQPAREAGRTNPDNYVELIKRSMGDKNFRRYINDNEYRPEQISAYILKKLKADAEEKLQQPVTEAVITVPAYFNEEQRTATEQAGIIAGLKVLGIIPEPTAAAVAYAATDSENQNLLVYDLGGGTFDVTIMKVEARKVRVVCVDGDHELGGRNWDEKIVAHLCNEWKTQTNSFDDPTADMETLQEFFKQAEEAKRSLTNREMARIAVSHAGSRARVELTREQFDQLTADLLDRTITLTKQAVEEAKRLGVTRIDKILLVGGSSYMPQVQARLQEEYPSIEQQLFEPEQAVAKGAAMYAANRQIQDAYQEALREMARQNGHAPKPLEELTPAEKKEAAKRVGRMLPGVAAEVIAAGPMSVVNVCSKNFGIEALDDNDQEIIEYLIQRNSPVPTAEDRQFYTRHATTQVIIRIFETEGSNPPQTPDHPGCREIKREVLHLPPGTEAGHPIRVRFALSEDGGRLCVSASDPLSGKSIDLSVENCNAIMQQELDAMKNQAAEVNIG